MPVLKKTTESEIYGLRIISIHQMMDIHFADPVIMKPPKSPNDNIRSVSLRTRNQTGYCPYSIQFIIRIQKHQILTICMICPRISRLSKSLIFFMYESDIAADFQTYLKEHEIREDSEIS